MDSIDQALTSGNRSDFDAALREINETLISIDSDQAKSDLLFRKAVLQAKFGHLADARRQLSDALKLAASTPSSRLSFDYISGVFFDEERKLEQAVTSLTRTLTTHSALLSKAQYRTIYEHIQTRRAFDLFQLNRFEEAMPILRECQDFVLSPEDRATVFAYLGVANVKAKDDEFAKDCFLKACELGSLPQRLEGDLHFGLAYSYANHIVMQI